MCPMALSSVRENMSCPTGRRVKVSMVSGVTKRAAFGVITTETSAPSRMNARAISGLL